MKTSPHIPWMFISIGAMIVGAITPWATVFGLSINGTEGDGPIIIVLAVFALAFAVVLAVSSKRPRPLWPSIVCLVLGALSAIVALYDWGSLEGLVSTGTLSDAQEETIADLVSVGWGLVLATVASASLVAASVYAIAKRRSEVAAPAPAPAPASAE